MLPGYIYSDLTTDNGNCLRQGDIIQLKGSLRKAFNKFFPGIIKPHQKRYIVVLSQCCDLYYNEQ